MSTHRDYVKTALDLFMAESHAKLPSLSRVLEVGSGSHPFKDYFEEKGLLWTGIDTASFDGADIGFMEDMPYGESVFDLLFACHSFEHCERPLDALKEFYRVLKPGGLLLLATPNPCEKQITRGDPDHIFVLNPMQMSKLCVHVGFLNGRSYLQTEGIGTEANYNVITTGVK